ncbi:MAG TPA: hypothetical protein VJI74_00240 [Candidatus Paceibacterota bacterium]
MLYFIHGTNAVAARKKLHAILDRALEKAPGTPVAMFHAETLVPEEIGALVAEQGLFTGNSAVVFDNVLGVEEVLLRVLGLLSEMKESRNLLLFLEAEPDAKVVSAFTKAGAEVHYTPAIATGPIFNVFSLTDAFGRRDKKKLWIEYRKALAKEGSDDSFLLYMNSMLFWQVKTMLLALLSKTAAESGLKPFSYQKARTFLKNYSREELEELSGKLVRLPHDAHRGLVDMEVGLERLVLSI